MLQENKTFIKFIENPELFGHYGLSESLSAQSLPASYAIHIRDDGISIIHSVGEVGAT